MAQHVSIQCGNSTITQRTPCAIAVTLLMAPGGLVSFGPFVLNTAAHRFTREATRSVTRLRTQHLEPRTSEL